MSVDRPSAQALEEWIAKSWDRRPPFSYDCLVEMWKDEQVARAREREKDWRSKQLDELRQRVAQLERILGPRGKRLTGDLIAGIGKALAEIREQDRARILGEIEARGFVTYGGVWDETVEYPRGALVTHGGSAWVALTPAEKGLKPGKAPAWRLAVKGESGSKGPTVE
jgi:hypothetical protein